MASPDKRQEILETARSMVQARGYNALSFRDIGERVGVKSASVHYHFPTKGDLGAALARAYTEEGTAYLATLLVEGDDLARVLRRYTDIFRSALVNDNRMCLCGIMTAEHDHLPEQVRAEVLLFTEANVEWLAALLERYEPDTSRDALRKRARSIYAAVQGAQLIARGRCDVGIFDEIMDSFRTSGLLG